MQTNVNIMPEGIPTMLLQIQCLWHGFVTAPPCCHAQSKMSRCDAMSGDGEAWHEEVAVLLLPNHCDGLTLVLSASHCAAVSGAGKAWPGKAVPAASWAAQVIIIPLEPCARYANSGCSSTNVRNPPGLSEASKITQGGGSSGPRP